MEKPVDRFDPEAFLAKVGSGKTILEFHKNQNVFEQKGYLNQICHLHPDTYNRLIDFAQRWKNDPEIKAFFHQECTFSSAQLARFEKYLLNAAATMQSRRTARKLLLDLDLDDFFKPEHS